MQLVYANDTPIHCKSGVNDRPIVCQAALPYRVYEGLCKILAISPFNCQGKLQRGVCVLHVMM